MKKFDRKFILYMRDGRFVVAEGRDVWAACKNIGIKSITESVDMYTDQSGPRYFNVNGSWVRGENPAIDEILAGDSEEPKQSAFVLEEPDLA